MAHSVLIGGTSYGIKGGKCLVDGTVYSIKRGIGLVDGTQVEYKFAVEPSFVINSKGDWDNFVQNASTFSTGELVRIGADIDLSGASYDAISYAGDFDGGNSKIINGEFSGGGIFASIGNGQKICNLTLDTITIQAISVDSYTYAGMLAPVAIGSSGGDTLIQNVHIEGGSVSANIAGGIIGQVGNYVTMIYCSCTGGEIYGGNYGGGIAGEFSGDIRQSYSTVSPSTQPILGYTGGISGVADGGTITSCWCTDSRISGRNTGTTVSKVLANATGTSIFDDVELETGKWFKFGSMLPSLIKPNCKYNFN